MSIFVSYARRDRNKVEAMVVHLRRLGREVWLDDSLVGGQAWWDEILSRIEACDALLFTISPQSVKSEACRSEAAYAKALGKQILPVSIEPVTVTPLPLDLAQLQIVDYTEPGAESAINLVNALNALRPSPPPPSVPPTRPSVPVSYISRLGLDAQDARTMDEQVLVVGKLADVAESADDVAERREAVAVLETMRSRRDLTLAAEHGIVSALERHGRTMGTVAKPEPAAPRPGPATVPPVAPPTEYGRKAEPGEPPARRWPLGWAIVASCVLALIPWATVGLATPIVYLLGAVLLRPMSRAMTTLFVTSAAVYAVADTSLAFTATSAPGTTGDKVFFAALLVSTVAGGIEGIALSPWVFRHVRAGA